MAAVSKSSDQEWLRGLYERNRDVVFRYATSRIGREAAMDVVSDTFVEAGRSRSSFDPGRGSETSWLLGIATNLIRRWHRDESRRGHPGQHEDGSQGIEDSNILSIPERVDSERSSREVNDAVAALPEGERTAILLHAVEGLTVAEVARSLGIGNSAAKVRIFRARRRLRTSLSHLEDSKETT